jgi:hypothetical protein
MDPQSVPPGSLTITISQAKPSIMIASSSTIPLSKMMPIITAFAG